MRRIERKWLVLLAAGTGTFLTALDTSIVNTTLPLIRRSFGAGFDQSEWVVTVYLLTLSGVLLSFGRLGDLRGHRRVFTLGFWLFALASLLCASSHALWALVAARAVQAVGGAMITSNAPALLTAHFPGEQRGQALGLAATMTYLGLTLGPTLGGFLASHHGWRSVFAVNLPISAAALLIALAFIPDDAPSEAAEPFDVAGAATFLLTMVVLLLAFNQGHRYGWTSLPILGGMGVAALLAGLFVAMEATRQHPMLDLGLFGEPVFRASVAAAVCNYICVYSIVFLVPFYLIDGRGLTAVQAGVVLTVQPLVMAITSPLAGAWSDRFGTRLPAVVGMLFLGAAIFWLSRLGPTTPLLWVGLRTGLAGLGTGLFTTPNNSALMGAAPRHRQGIASGMLASARNVGMALGVGLSGAVVTTVMAHWPAGSHDGLFSAVRWAYAVVALVAVVGAAISAVRSGTQQAAGRASREPRQGELA